MKERQEDRRSVAREIFMRGLAATTVAAAVERSVRCEGTLLEVGGRMYDLQGNREVCMVSIGKAGSTLFDAMDALLPPSVKRSAVISAPAPPERMSTGVRYFQGGHPEPNAASVEAARAALAAVSECPEEALVIFLISGGASAMCELPIGDDISLEDMALLNRALTGSGASIAEVNCVRKKFSRVKGGRLAVAAGGREKITLLVSDVPDHALDALGSGPSLPDRSTVEDCLAVISRYALWDRLPVSVRRCMEAGLDESPAADHPAFRNAADSVLLGNETIVEQAGHFARELGYRVEVDSTCDDWDYQEAAKYLLAKLRALRGPEEKVCLLSGGEVTVRLPEHPGVGGRNQQFCLFCATQDLADGTTILSAGTDGIDGSSPAAGAVVDASTRRRGEQLGMKIEESMRNFDAFHYFEGLGDAVVTGPTGNNLRDIRILLWDGVER